MNNLQTPCKMIRLIGETGYIIYHRMADCLSFSLKELNKNDE